MDIYNKLVTGVGDPLLFFATAFGVGYFIFKEKKKVEALYTLVLGGVVYYVMHNITSVLPILGRIGEAFINFLGKIF